MDRSGDGTRRAHARTPGGKSEGGTDVVVNSVRMAERAETFSSRHRRLA